MVVGFIFIIYYFRTRYIAPPKMKVKGYMYPQMKKPVGMLNTV
jgi:hypothetical protein